MRKLVVAAILLVAIAAANPEYEKPQTQSHANMNEYFDALTGQLQTFFLVNGLDPMPLPDMMEGFSVKDLIGIRWHGELELTRGWMQNLSHLRRVNEAFMDYEKKQLEVSFELAFDDSVMMSYDFRAQVMNLGPKGSIHGKVKKLQILMDFIVDIETLEISVKDIRFTKTGRITVKIESIGILDFIANAIINTTTLIFKGLIVSVVEVTIRSTFEAVVGSIHLGDILLGGNRQ